MAADGGAGGSGDVSTLTVADSWMSDDALRNSRMLLPRDAPTSGSFPGPRMMRAITRMMTSSSGPGVGMRCGSLDGGGGPRRNAYSWALRPPYAPPNDSTGILADQEAAASRNRPS